MNHHKALCHHGIKGQKWGVRRYQNPDGSLTSAGRDRYGVETIKKGSTVRRVTARKSKNANSAGMYTYGKGSEDFYLRNAKALPSVKGNRKVRVTQYEFVKDAKLLPGKSAVDAYMNDFGNMTVSDFSKNYAIDYRNREFIDALSAKYSKEKVSDAYRKMDYSDSGKLFAHEFLYQTASTAHVSGSNKTKMEAFTEKFKNLGYDAIIDPEDYSNGSDEPIIVLNSSSVKEKGHYNLRLK